MISQVQTSLIEALTYPGDDAIVTALRALELGVVGGDGLTTIAEFGRQLAQSARRLDAPTYSAHMDPPTLWVTWVAHAWAARLNQNLLHPDTGAFVREVESELIQMLAPTWGMATGQFVPGSTLANITALWAARDFAACTTVCASSASHLSIEKAARILGMDFVQVPVDSHQRLRRDALPSDLSATALVLTAGTTATGAFDPLDAISDVRVGGAAWIHVDGAWGGGLGFSPTHRQRVDPIRHADSMSFSNHKWLYQPKDSALVLFRSTEPMKAITFGAEYLAAPNVGVLGSKGAANVLAMKLSIEAYGVDTFGTWIDASLDAAAQIRTALMGDDRFDVHPASDSGIVVWRHRQSIPVSHGPGTSGDQGPAIQMSTVNIDGLDWWRCVCLNPFVDTHDIVESIMNAA